MYNFLYEEAKKALREQEDINGIAKISSHYEYKSYFHILTYKYFIHNPKKSDNREDYNSYYRTINDKSEIENLSSYFNRRYDECLKSANENELYNGNVEDLEKIVAQYEIAVSKTISMCKEPATKDFLCSKEYILECMNCRDSMIEKIEKIKSRTVEFRRNMWD